MFLAFADANANGGAVQEEMSDSYLEFIPKAELELSCGAAFSNRAWVSGHGVQVT